MTVHDYIANILVKEGNGKFTNDPNDSGGATRWGITQTTARNYGYMGNMASLPKEVAEAIYLAQYWLEPGFDKVNELDEPIAERLMDFGVLAGQTTSAKMLQRALNVLNQNGKDFSDIEADGKIGPATLKALEAFLDKRKEGPKVLLGMIAAQQAVYLIELTEKRPKDEEYIYGWELNRAIGAIL